MNTHFPRLSRLPSRCRLLPAADWIRGVWHSDDGGGPISHWHLLRRHLHLVSNFLSLNKCACYFPFRYVLIQTAAVSIWLCSKDAVPEFELRVALWSCAVEDDLTLVNTPKKLAKKLRNSFGRSAGKKLCPLLDTPDPDTFLQHNPIPAYVIQC